MPWKCDTDLKKIRCTHEVCMQTYSWGASAPLLQATVTGYLCQAVVKHLPKDNNTLGVRALEKDKK